MLILQFNVKSILLNVHITCIPVKFECLKPKTMQLN